VELKDRIKELRKLNGMTQIQAADSLGVARRTYQDYEFGVSSPNSETMQKMADLFHVSVDYIIGRTDLSSDEYLMALPGKSLNELTDEQKAAVKNVIETFLKQNKK
jgi:transcriptional regulator with XRE-family HTH domain